ncbi:MAG TPA: response regulator [Anaeromyxobacteraceae bacterium]|nr:response regulator [Anaeromyxobacteraceae bacterium]
MPTILTVDDSRAVRTIVSKQVKDLGFEVVEAEDGIQGLAKLAECQFDLVILDVTMPNMDGPTMLGKMREASNLTPVIMLTSESKRSIIAGAMKSGITDYILKPFKPEELRSKILTVLQGGGGAEDVVASSMPGGAPAAGVANGGAREPAGAGTKQFCDVMVVDDMENVHKRLRGMLPNHLTMNGFTSAQSALASAREKVYRVILVDTDIPDVNSAVLAQQIKVLQPHAAFVALALRTNAQDQTKELKDQGFGEVLYKPFTQDHVDDFLVQYFDNQEFLTSEDNLLKVSPFVGKPERLDRYFARLGQLFPNVLNKVASACYEEIILDLGQVPTQGDRLPKLLVSVAGQAKEVGMTMTVVGPTEIQKMLASFEETSAMKYFGTIQEARAAAA